MKAEVEVPHSSGNIQDRLRLMVIQNIATKETITEQIKEAEAQLRRVNEEIPEAQARVHAQAAAANINLGLLPQIPEPRFIHPSVMPPHLNHAMLLLLNRLLLSFEAMDKYLEAELNFWKGALDVNATELDAWYRSAAQHPVVTNTKNFRDGWGAEEDSRQHEAVSSSNATLNYHNS
ncbi:hypothetical protein EVJ58_g1714 [Rhodofomes roseus]|uniref:Uncharacterized protein n=1 Tax=Rhodofomes roseus TaxID=34475 RepID=A0A4Y9YZY0_9APHY|nr:hypothetical protein EVJ58_g1714 [Rhodofomes roseus]